MIVQIINERSGFRIHLPLQKTLHYIDVNWPSPGVLVEEVSSWLERHRREKGAARHFPGMFWLTIIEPDQ